MARSFRVPVHRTSPTQTIAVESGATVGAQIGTNLLMPDGTLATTTKLQALLGTTPGQGGASTITTTDDLEEGQWNYYFTDRRAQDAVGEILADSANVTLRYVGGDSITADLTDLADTGAGALLAVTRDGKGRLTGTRAATITGTAGRVTVAHGDASDGLPTIDLATVADAGGGTLQRTAFDAWGRRTGTSAATTNDLAEGSNLYYTDARADGRIAVAKADPDGIASLVDGKLDPGQLPALAITETFVVADEASMLALVAEQGDVAVRTDLSKSFILTADPASTLSNWQELLVPTAGVTSFNGRTGSVTPVSGDYTFSQIGSKPTTLAGYGITDAQAFIAAGTTTQYWRGDKTWQTLDKAAVGLGNVDNTSDAAKPVSTAQAAADDLRVPKSGGAMTGPLTLPGDPVSALQAVPKQYVDAAVAQPTPRAVVATAETFLTAVGGETGAVLTIDGFPLEGAPTVTAIHRTDWQGRLLLYSTARTNYCRYSQDLAQTTWVKAASGTGVLPAVTSNYAVAPDGSATADRVILNRGAGTTASDYSSIQATVTGVSAGQQISESIWAKTNDGSTVQVQLRDDNQSGLTPRVISVTPAWQRFSLAGVSVGTVANSTRLWLRGTQGTSNYADLSLWQGQFEYAASPTSAIPTLAVSVSITDYALSGSAVSFGEAATAGAVYDWDGSGVPKYPASFAGPVRVGSYTLSTLLNAAAFAGYLITVSDATGGQALCLSNGTDWIDIHTNAAVA